MNDLIFRAAETEDAAALAEILRQHRIIKTSTQLLEQQIERIKENDDYYRAPVDDHQRMRYRVPCRKR